MAEHVAGEDRWHLGLPQLGALAGGFGTLMGVVVVLDPLATPVMIDALWGVSWAFGVLVSLVLTGHSDRVERSGRCPPLVRFASHFEKSRRTHVVLVLGVGALLVVANLWQPPTADQLAQRMLNDRGMPFTPEDYQTQLEVGNATALRLYHWGGFDPQVGWSLLASDAKTLRDSKVVQAVLKNEYGDLIELFRELGQPVQVPELGIIGRITAAASEPAEYPYLDTPLKIDRDDIAAARAMPGATTAASSDPQIRLSDVALLSNSPAAVAALVSLGARVDSSLWAAGPYANASILLLEADPGLLLHEIGADADSSLVHSFEERLDFTRLSRLLLDDGIQGYEASDFHASCVEDGRFVGYLSMHDGAIELLHLTRCQAEAGGEIFGVLRLPGMYDADHETGGHYPYVFRRLTYEEDDLADTTPLDRSGVFAIVDVDDRLKQPTADMSYDHVLALRSTVQVTPLPAEIAAPGFDGPAVTVTARSPQYTLVARRVADDEAHSAERFSMKPPVDSELRCAPLGTAHALSPGVAYTLSDCSHGVALELADTDGVLFVLRDAEGEILGAALGQERLEIPMSEAVLRLDVHSLYPGGADMVSTATIARYLPALRRLDGARSIPNIELDGMVTSALHTRGRIDQEDATLAVDLDVSAPLDLIVELTELRSDVDVFLSETRPNGASWSGTKGGAEPELVRALLVPGTHRLSLSPFGSGSPYRLSVAAEPFDPTLLDLASQSCAPEAEGETTLLNAGMFEFNLASPARLRLEPEDGDAEPRLALYGVGSVSPEDGAVAQWRRLELTGSGARVGAGRYVLRIEVSGAPEDRGSPVVGIRACSLDPAPITTDIAA